MKKSTSLHASENAKTLRRNMTLAERLLWKHIRMGQIMNLHVRRQSPIGNYVVDFLVSDCSLIIELDGESHHYSVEKDKARDEFFKKEGYQVIRFKNQDVFARLDDVLEAIRCACEKRLQSLPQDGGG